MEMPNDMRLQANWIRRLHEMPFAQRKRIVLYCSLLIAIASLAPKSMMPESPGVIPEFDKIVHFSMYAALAGLAFWSIRPTQSLRLYAIPVFAGAFSYGLLMELLQGYVTVAQRSFSYGDIAANGAGAAVCLAVLACRARCVRVAAAALCLITMRGNLA